MKILTWNIKHGENKPHLVNITDTLVTHDPDILVLTEFREGPKGDFIRNRLSGAGWVHQSTSGPAPNTNGLLIAAKGPLSPCKGSIAPTESHRWMEFEVDEVRFLAIHIPINTTHTKTLFWDKVLQRADSLVDRPALIIGDFNTGLPADAQGTPFHCVESMQRLLNMGWQDAWRLTNGSRQEYSWYSHVGNGFRIDHAFVSDPVKDRVVQCYYSHPERELRYSDHSALIIELAR